jgi:hypothetical protein
MLRLEPESTWKEEERGVDEKEAGGAQQETNERRAQAAAGEPVLVGGSAFTLFRSRIHAVA